MKLLIVLLKLILFVAVSPFISGLITKIKNNLRMRKGQSIFQPYYNMRKLFSKGEVVSDTASWVYRITPPIVVSSVLAAALLVILSVSASTANYLGDLLALIFILSLGRFFLALSALDTGSSFGGMGSSREMFISGLAEPALCAVIFSLLLQSGSTSISLLSLTHKFSVTSIAAGISLFLVVIAETSRLPVDNQETHLELTMVHEAMVLEYSGKSLALIELASYIKQLIWFFLISIVIFPAGLFWHLAGIIIISVIVALLEVSVAKMRLFRVADFLGFAFVLGIVATVCAIMGV